MPQLTIGRMAKLYGLHRSTLHEAVKKGRLSSVLDETGIRVIDLSEMIRVYGEPKASPYTALQLQKVSAHTSSEVNVEALMNELKMLRAEVSELRNLMLRIEHQPEQSKKPLGSTTVKSFADLLNSI